MEDTVEPLPLVESEAVALGVQSNPGVYALLLGAGVSVSSGVPGARGITDELCKKLAMCQGVPDVQDGRLWFEEKFGAPPTYSGLFERLSTSGVERVGLLRSYFEASEEDVELGLKVPTPAHRAIAGLVAKGFVKVVITTNFDQLLETALRELGINPIVVSSEANAIEKPPFVHNRCTILKIHGDYLDSTFRNTTDELSSYPMPLREKLGQILSEYGLIVCGWSGEYDVALREALLDPNSQQYSTLYWCARGGKTSGSIRAILDARDGRVVSIESADEFFGKLTENVEALVQMSERANLTEDLARARAKVYVTNPVKRAQFHDLVVVESHRVAKRMDEVFVNGRERTSYEPLDLLQLIERETEVLRNILATGCFFDDGTHNNLWKRCIEILLPRRNGYIAETGAELYPALLALYTIGITARLQSKDDTTRTILWDTVWQFSAEKDTDRSVSSLLYPGNVIEDILRKVPQYISWIYSGQLYLCLSKENSAAIWSPVRLYTSSDREFDNAFNSFEYLLGATYLFERGAESRWAPPIAAMFTTGSLEVPKVATATLETVMDLEERGEVWGPVSSGMFNGSMKDCKTILLAYNEILARIRISLI